MTLSIFLWCFVAVSIVAGTWMLVVEHVERTRERRARRRRAQMRPLPGSHVRAIGRGPRDAA